MQGISLMVFMVISNISPFRCGRYGVEEHLKDLHQKIQTRSESTKGFTPYLKPIYSCMGKDVQYEE